jgi:hypothetical protein
VTEAVVPCIKQDQCAYLKRPILFFVVVRRVLEWTIFDKLQQEQQRDSSHVFSLSVSASLCEPHY